MVFNLFEVFNEEKCPSCSSVLQWGVTTKYDKKTDKEVCTNCKSVLGEWGFLIIFLLLLFIERLFFVIMIII
jgi:hypothetical protein